MSSLRDKVENFLYKEARLMDENRYLEWVELYADECLYWIPCNEEDYDPAKHVSMLYADQNVLKSHAMRLDEGKAFAQQPRSRMRRIVSNIEIDGADDDEEIGVFANFTVTEIRKHEQRLHSGRSEYKLVAENGSFRIKYKKVNLVSIDEAQDNVTFLL